MKSFALLVLLAVAAAAKDKPDVKTEPSVNQLKLQIATLSMSNAQLTAHVEGLQKELEATRSQLIQMQNNALVSELCSAAGIAPKECSVAQDGSVSKTPPPPAEPPEEPAKPAPSKQ